MSHYDIHVGDVIKYPEMVMARTVHAKILLTEKDLRRRLLLAIEASTAMFTSMS